MNVGTKMALAPDSFVPQRDILLDVDEVARLFSARLGSNGPVEIDRCERLRVKYRVGDYMRVLLRIQVGHSSYTIAARTFPTGSSEAAYERAVRVALPCGPLRPVLLDSDLDTIFWLFPNDWKIAGLRSLEKIRQSLSHVLDGAWTQSHLVAYAPGKCATMQCLDEHSGILAYAKIYAEDGARRIYEVYSSLRQSLLATDSNLLLPRALAYSEVHQTLLLEPIEGRPISDLDDADLPNGFRQLGTALAALHELSPAAHLPQFKRVESSSLIRSAQIVGRARPDVALRAEKLARELCSRRPSGEPLVWLHGDVHPKNGILRNDSLALIDLDQSAAGTAAADLGSLLAVLHYNRRIGLLPLTVARELAEAFLAGYSAVRPLPDVASLTWHTAASLLSERALRAVNRIRLEGLQYLGDLLADAKVIVSGGRHV